MKRKLIVGGVLFFIGSLINVWFSTYAHLVLTKSFTKFSDIRYMECLYSIFTNKNHTNLFLVMELLIFTLILILAITYNSDKSSYTSKINNITNYIETPEKAGQNQYGSARWLTEEEKDEVFDTAYLEGKLIDELASHGYDDLEFMKGE